MFQKAMAVAITFFAFGIATVNTAGAQEQQPGIIDQAAPKWGVSPTRIIKSSIE